MGQFYECLTGSIECVKAPDDNEFGIKKGKEYDIVDGRIRGIEHPFEFLDISEVNWYYKKYNIRFKVAERLDM
jgi:hypothetical protein